MLALSLSLSLPHARLSLCAADQSLLHMLLALRLDPATADTRRYSCVMPMRKRRRERLSLLFEWDVESPEKQGTRRARRTQSGHSGTADTAEQTGSTSSSTAIRWLAMGSTRDGERISAANACSTMLLRKGTQNAEKQEQRNRELLKQQLTTDISSRGQRLKRGPRLQAPPLLICEAHLRLLPVVRDAGKAPAPAQKRSAARRGDGAPRGAGHPRTPDVTCRSWFHRRSPAAAGSLGNVSPRRVPALESRRSVPLARAR